MRILFVSPYTEPDSIPLGHWTPLHVPFMAALLQEKGHTVSLFDRYAAVARVGLDKSSVDRAMLDHVRRFRPDLIGFNTLSPLIHDTVTCAEMIRSIYGGPMVAGGHHASALPELTLQRIPELSGVVEGEGEFPMLHLAEGNDPEHIHGLWWKRSANDIVHTPPRQIRDLDRLPVPALDVLDLRFYRRANVQALRGFYLSSLSLLTSRGCVRKCDFCAESLTYGQGVRYHGAEYVLAWLERVVGTHPVEAVYFLDNDFLGSESRAVSICEGILNRGLHRKIRWGIQARVDRIQPGMVRLLKQAGCILVEIGVESGSQKDLDSVHKGSDVSLNEHAVSILRRNGMACHVYMMAGFPGETWTDLDRKLDWLERFGPVSCGLALLQLYPKTRMYRNKGCTFFETRPWTQDEVRRFFNTVHFAEFSDREWRSWYNERYLKYFRRRYHLNLLQRNAPSRLLRFVIQARLRSGLL